MFKIKSKSLKSARNTVIALIVTLLAIFIAGFIYTWYSGKDIAVDEMGAEESTVVENRNYISPTKPDPNAAVGVSIYSLPPTTKPGEKVSVFAKTNAQAKCVITVSYNKEKTLKDIDEGLIEKSADEYGMVRWEWITDYEAPKGKWPVEITCSNSSKSGYSMGEITVN